MLKDFITEKGIQHLKEHRYVGGAYTSLDNTMNKFWTACIDYMPTYISPNMITFIGNFTYILTVLLLMRDDMSFSIDKPRFYYFLCGLSILFYQTMDALDGKQARRLGRSTPLGQMVDHGSDCITTTFLVYNIMSCFRIENDNIAAMMSCLLMVFTFYYANWAEHFTGILVTSSNDFGVTEIQFVLTAFNWLTALFGSGIWHISIFGRLTRDQAVLHHVHWAVPFRISELRSHPQGRLLQG